MSGINSALSVVVAGGGTAGHIEPALAVADAVKALAPDTTVTALGTARGLETTLVPARGYTLELIPPVPLPRKPTMDLVKLPLRIRASVRKTREVLDAVDADVIVGFGGYVALPAYLAARGGVLRRRRTIPIVIHEANASAGIANKIGARLATRVLAAVPGSGVKNRGASDADIVGIPVRASIANFDRAGLRAQAREYFGLPLDGPVLLVFGGSQGAKSLNDAVSGAARELADAGISVLHAHGPKNTLDAAQFSEAAPYVAVPYLSRMDLAYAAADAAICRSGAMTVAEVSSVGLPAVYVPLPHGNGEQELNAKPVVAAGGAVIVSDADLTPAFVADTVVPLLTDSPRLQAMSAAAAGVGHRTAATEIARIVLDTARKSNTEARNNTAVRNTNRGNR
ncbi:undecaprenyldiphospho-muramoylpentapeptide beta-N-acetylglucosaminyltransferase [Rhodococcus sp. AD45-ID]|uniref:undecaprenyldiphospho-muramoylpentapeptide beta-N-acetylglucosaminyltransferase n=1 Tax=unclassified Rhodococcus (in: high G+C Gram-positive bacteria) TaxID=192944 RepID=UPI0005D38BE1|nr:MULTISPECIES: undecaprenyldiphospho-muramoylpentapeptide beta-N-acetylglucosaminyltransferase [unclassified Rhodococcus (in: high G+C Gram-positive bacteria)]KJF19886.1 UDP-N-acetylglucosamine--N-acetylmuramyl-(pentapeptide) pyrophosphoryl-undecaprenol transferase [Rhodococcus sp. AD45]PSR41034.1 undecaprenyldiphospho-muramoylpentapeptide beta-N-acetylglucosaminyltransferase [Rhodococcus sp. AD45-ID]ROZ48679.1 undecaprenyldiphospho-muramoylpentapeptide beta-N-acetylglucosaminyltransferase [Rh